MCNYAKLLAGLYSICRQPTYKEGLPEHASINTDEKHEPTPCQIQLK